MVGASPSTPLAVMFSCDVLALLSLFVRGLSKKKEAFLSNASFIHGFGDSSNNCRTTKFTLHAYKH